MFALSKILLKPSIKPVFFPKHLISPMIPFTNTKAYYFSTESGNKSDTFKDRDKAELELYEAERLLHWKYKKIRDDWQKPLERKRQRRERLSQRPKVISEKETQKLVVHNPAVGIEMQPKEREIFAVLEIAGFQFKVVADDQVVCEYLEDYDINEHIVFDKVLMVGTKDYTSIGRPFVETAKVYATVEEQCMSEKVIVFKKRRRKHYKRTAGAKQHLTVLRIDKIEHVLDQNVLSKAVALV